MSAGAHRGDHDKAHYEADIGETRAITVTIAGEELVEEEGPLIPGRYLLQFFQTSGAPSAICWVHVAPWEEGAIGPTTGPGLQRVPLSGQAILGIEYHALTDHNDRVAAILTAGTGVLYMTRISTKIRKHETGA